MTGFTLLFRVLFSVFLHLLHVLFWVSPLKTVALFKVFHLLQLCLHSVVVWSSFPVWSSLLSDNTVTETSTVILFSLSATPLITVFPAFFALTTPFADTSATDSSEEVQLTCGTVALDGKILKSISSRSPSFKLKSFLFICIDVTETYCSEEVCPSYSLTTLSSLISSHFVFSSDIVEIWISFPFCTGILNTDFWTSLPSSEIVDVWKSTIPRSTALHFREYPLLTGSRTIFI